MYRTYKLRKINTTIIEHKMVTTKVMRQRNRK